MKQALLDGDSSYLARQGIQQAEADAHLLDVNVGLPGLDEAAAMKQAVKALQEVLDLPLCSTPPLPPLWRPPCGCTAAAL